MALCGQLTKAARPPLPISDDGFLSCGQPAIGPPRQVEGSLCVRRMPGTAADGVHLARAASANAAAFAFLDQHALAPILRVFALERPTLPNSGSSACAMVQHMASLQHCGSRVFVVTRPGRFWREYSATPHEERHHYEVIREGRPCHLYFDLEFAVEANPGVDGAKLVVLLLAEVDALLQLVCDIPLHPGGVVELDSSTPQKFSRHLIVRLPCVAFANNVQAGVFARAVVARMLARAQHSSAAAGIVVQRPSSAGLGCFVDLGVYSRNRMFRLYLSSKAGKTAHMAATGRYGTRNMSPRQVFFASLITVSRMQQPSQQPEVSLLYMDAAAGEALEHWTARPVAWPCALPPCTTGPGVCAAPIEPLPTAWLALLRVGPGTTTGARKPAINPTGPNVDPDHNSRDRMDALLSVAIPAPSPYPCLEAFIESRSTQGGVQGSVRTWQDCAAPPIILLNVGRNRWCGNVGRAHRSNGIYFVVDVRAGTWQQRCYDPECRAYRAPLMPLPASVWEPTRVQHAQRGAAQQAYASDAGGAPDYIPAAGGRVVGTTGGFGQSSGSGPEDELEATWSWMDARGL